MAKKRDFDLNDILLLRGKVVRVDDDENMVTVEFFGGRRFTFRQDSESIERVASKGQKAPKLFDKP